MESYECGTREKAFGIGSSYHQEYRFFFWTAGQKSSFEVCLLWSRTCNSNSDKQSNDQRLQKYTGGNMHTPELATLLSP